VSSLALVGGVTDERDSSATNAIAAGRSRSSAMAARNLDSHSSDTFAMSSPG